MRATEAYFKAKEAEIMRMEDPIASSEAVSPAVPMPSVASIPPMPVSTTIPPATSDAIPQPNCEREAAIGTEDGILLRCIERYIEEYSNDPNELKPVRHILSEWLGYSSIITDSVRKEIKNLNKIIVRKQKENKQPAINAHNSNVQIGNDLSYNRKL